MEFLKRKSQHRFKYKENKEIMYKVIILDLDNTLIDFNHMEKESLKACLLKHGYEIHDQMIETYRAINKKLWEGLERGDYEKSEILTLRFKKWLSHHQLEGHPELLNKDFLDGLADHLIYMPGARALLEFLKGKYTTVLMTNGVYSSQQQKLDKGDMRGYFDHIIISDVIGYHKPQIGIFEHMMSLVGQYDKDEVMIIGDSLGSDILGGNNYGIHTCFYNPKNIEYNNYKATYEIQSFDELYQILSSHKKL